ncbi:MAG: phosphatidate cytidylyltransferase [Hyphomicrobiales bacterium]|nr:phosphatidate cytidylyltransferase [Hyphomicrobiales bacterium]
MKAGASPAAATAREDMPSSELRLRFVSSIVLLIVAGVGAWWGGIATAVVVAAVVAIVHAEWTGVTEGSAPRLNYVTIILALAMITAGIWHVGVALAVGALILTVATGPRPWRPAGVVYVASFGLSLLALRASDAGLEAIALLFAVVWATDIGAYFIGRSLGGPKLWPALSPNKTWSGAIGGLVVSLVTGSAVATVIGAPLTLPLAVVMAALSIAGQAGDLFESFVKRRFGTKDAGSIIPGHGGMMDRVDGLVFASVAAVLIGFIHSGATDLAGGLIWW